MAIVKNQQPDELKREFDELVNMSAPALKKWLQTEESRSVGQRENGDSESIGHQSGERIAAIITKKPADLDADDIEQIHRTISYIRRHSAQRPDKVAGSHWAHSLKNWGHDPEK
jgi:Protein of unknown function (DUF3140)